MNTDYLQRLCSYLDLLMLHKKITRQTHLYLRHHLKDKAVVDSDSWICVNIAFIILESQRCVDEETYKRLRELLDKIKPDQLKKHD